jgi:glycine cleavage system pyridoxal-binding protein P
MSNASLLDESTAGAEAMSMCYSLKNQKKKSFFVDENCHPQNIALAQTRGEKEHVSSKLTFHTSLYILPIISYISILYILVTHLKIVN